MAIASLPSTAALELRSLRCVRGDRLLFDGLSAVCPVGSVLRVEGPNGSGKTSLLRMICGLTMPAAGEILWRSRPVWPLSDAFCAHVIHLGHAPALKGELTATENLRAACALAGRPCSASEAATALAAAGLREQARLPARALSQGQRRRAVLARLALGATAGLWVLDEPFDALDDAARRWLRGLIAGQAARGGVVVMTSHDPVAWDAGLAQTTVALGAPVAAALEPAA